MKKKIDLQKGAEVFADMKAVRLKAVRAEVGVLWLSLPVPMM